MSPRVVRARSAALIAAALLAACEGHGGFAPGGTPLTAPATASHGVVHPKSLRDCSLSTVTLPGRYILMESEGNVRGTSYKSVNGIWAEGLVSVTAPTPKPTTAPSPPPTNVDLYTGTYHLSSGQTGCLYLFASVGGTALDGNDNAILTGTPSFANDAIAFKDESGGRFEADVQNLSDTGGSGTIRLMLPNGTTYNHGTLQIAKRLHIGPFARSRESAPVSVLDRPKFHWSCHTFAYMDTTVLDAKIGTQYSWFYNGTSKAVYIPRFTYCGAAGAFVPAGDVTSRQDVLYLGHLLKAKVDLYATFRGSKPNTLVSVWEEAYAHDGTRTDQYDVPLQLVRVIP